jgi:hypothetical protein
LNPSFKLWIYATGAANIGVSSMALFVAGRVDSVGDKVPLGATFKTNVGNASEIPLQTVRVERAFNGTENRSGYRPMIFSVSASATGQVLIRFYKNATLTGANFAAIPNVTAPLAVDTTATAVSGGTPVGGGITTSTGGSTVISVGDTGLDIEAGETLTITAQQTSGVNGTIAISVVGIVETGCGGR